MSSLSAAPLPPASLASLSSSLPRPRLPSMTECPAPPLSRWRGRRCPLLRRAALRRRPRPRPAGGRPKRGWRLSARPPDAPGQSRAPATPGCSRRPPSPGPRPPPRRPPAPKRTFRAALRVRPGPGSSGRATRDGRGAGA